VGHGTGSRSCDVKSSTGGSSGNVNRSGDDLRTSAHSEDGKKGEKCYLFFHGDIVPFFVEYVFTLKRYNTGDKTGEYYDKKIAAFTQLGNNTFCRYP